ncbi:tetratricopeptide repeat protein [Flavobacterium sp.]|uniref:tetratricopeptide repeat-containing sensor histidine kinase n=1 Tax=Flavobacterium sp. TaxID=239 RepID=UPI0037506284
MKKIFLIVIISVFIFSCSKNKKEIKLSEKLSDSTALYILKSRINDVSEKEILRSLDKIVILLEKSKNSIENRQLNYEVISKYYSLNDWIKYKKAAKLLLNNSLSANDSINIAKSYRSYGNYYFQEKILDSAFSFYSKSEKIYKKLNDNDGYSTILLKKGIIQYYINDYLAADLTLSKALSISKKSNDNLKKNAILNQLGLTCNQLGQHQKAINYLEESLRIIKEHNLADIEHLKSICYSNIGLVYQDLKNHKKAIYYFKLSLNTKDLMTNNPKLYSNIIDNLAYSKLEINDYKDLPNLFLESLELRKKVKDTSSVIMSYNHLSEFYFKKGDKYKSLNYANQSLKLANKTKIPFDILLSLRQISLIDEKNLNKYSQDFIRISDSLQIAERNSKDRFARIELETDELKKENNVLEEKNRNILNYFSVTMLIVGFLFFMRMQRAKSREIVLRQAQQKANEDIYKLIISQQSKLDEGRIMEKTRIAKELHDGVLGRMFGLRLNLDGLNQRTDNDAVGERLTCLEELKTIEQDLREISHELSREKYVLINNFVAIVNNLLEEQTKVNKAVLNPMIGENIDWDLLNNTTKINLYRILQESLQNINKYAKAKIIKVEFKKDKKGNLILNIADDGIGYNVDKKNNGIGIKNIVDRTHESEGTVEIKSTLNKGTQIKIIVPLEHKSIKI